MSDARDTLRTLVPIDRCVAVWCAAQCPRTVLRYVPAGEDRPRLAIEAAEAWAREPTEANRTVANAAANAAANSAANAANAAAYSADAAAYAAYAADANAAYAAAYSAYAAAYAANAAANAAAYSAALADLDTLIRGQHWRPTAPTLEQLCEYPRLAVAWDHLATAGDLTVAQLIEAYALSQSLDLDWSHPAARAVCERIAITPNERVMALLRRAA